MFLFHNGQTPTCAAILHNTSPHFRNGHDPQEVNRPLISEVALTQRTPDSLNSLQNTPLQIRTMQIDIVCNLHCQLYLLEHTEEEFMGPILLVRAHPR